MRMKIGWKVFVPGGLGRGMVLLIVLWGLTVSGSATSVTVELPSGAMYAISLRSLDPTAPERMQHYLAVSAVAFVLKQYNEQSRCEWDARTGLLHMEVGLQRFLLSSGVRAEVVIGDKRYSLARPLKVVEGELWMPLESFRLIARSLEGFHLIEPPDLGTAVAPTPPPIVQSPQQALDGGAAGTTLDSTLPSTAPIAAVSAPLLPPIAPSDSWVVVLDPAWIEGAGESPEVAGAIRPALVQIGERCAALLREEGTIEAALLSEHDERTSPDIILEWLARQSPDVAILLRFEVSPLRTQPGYAIYYADASVDWQEPEGPGGATSASAGLVPRAQSYQAFQRDSRRLAENIASGFAALPGFRDRLVLPAPLYILKRCPARAVLIVWSFPEHSPEIARLADSGYREGLARALAGAVIAFRRESAGGS